MRKITIIVADGRVESVFLPKDLKLDVDVCDFDTFNLTESEELGDYVDELRSRKTLKEIVC